MNDELKTKEYLKSIGSIKLSDSSRLRMREELLAHARFYTVQEKATPVKSPFMWLLLKPVQAAFAFVLVLGTGAAMYLGGTNPQGEPLATNEAPFIEESVTPVPTEESENSEETSGDKFAMAPRNTPSPSTNESAGIFNDNARSIAMKESADVVSDETMMTIMLSQGEMNIDDYRADIMLREKTYRALITRYEKEIGTDTTAEFITKLNTIATLLKDAEGKEDVEARPLLDKAMTYVGEIESTLSLLGTVTVEEGVIIKIDF